jgi:CRISPR-associated protein Cas1
MSAAEFALPLEEPVERRRLPDYLPARMLNEFVYCPRLFFYEWVEGLFAESADTIEGKLQHSRVDDRTDAMPLPEEAGEQPIHSRSITLSSQRHRLIARIDLVEGEQGVVSPVDYKHGAPRETDGGLEPWPADRIQLAAQALVLRENGYCCEEGIIYYARTRQRVRVRIDAGLEAETAALIEQAMGTALAGRIPPPLVDSPKCPKCSLAGICLPDETHALTAQTVRLGDGGAWQLALFDSEEAGPPRKPAASEIRRLIPARDDLRPLYLNTQGTRVGKSGEVLQVREKDELKQEVRISDICQVNLFGNVQLSTQAIQTLCAAEIPINYFSQGGWFYGVTTGLHSRNVFLRRRQFQLAEEPWFALSLARRLVAGKIRNQRTLLQRNHVEPPADALRDLKIMAEKAERAQDTEELLGIEGNAASIYFQHFGGMLKAREEEEEEASSKASEIFRFDFVHRNRRPPRDPVNALLSLAYSVLAKDMTVVCNSIGFDPYLGFYHQMRFGRPALALDLMEPFRPLIADSAVLSAINTGMVTEDDFIRAGPAAALKPGGRKGFFRAYELRMDTLATHPLFDYRVSYRRMLEIQARLLARYIDGEIEEYPVFLTR